MNQTREIDVRYDAVSALFSALASPVRCALIHRLTEGPASVGELVERLELSQPLVSQHLRILRGAGLVRSVRTGRAVTYSLVDEHVSHVFLDALEHAEEHP